MPSMRKIFRSKKSKSCSSMVVELPTSGTDNGEQTSSSRELSLKPIAAASASMKGRRHSYGTEAVPVVETKKGNRRYSFGRKPSKLLGRSLRNLLVKRSSSGSLDPTSKFEDSIRTADTSDSNPAWDHGSVTDTSFTMTPPRTQEKVGATGGDLEIQGFVEEVVETTGATVEMRTQIVESKIDEVIEPMNEAAEIAPEAQETALLLLEMEESTAELATVPEVENTLEGLGKRIAEVIEERETNEAMETHEGNEGDCKEVAKGEREDMQMKVEGLDPKQAAQKIEDNQVVVLVEDEPEDSGALEAVQVAKAKPSEQEAKTEAVRQEADVEPSEQEAKPDDEAKAEPADEAKAGPVESEAEQTEAALEASMKVPELVEVPEPPSVPRNQELLELLNKANITTDVETNDTDTVAENKVQRIVDERVLEVIEEEETSENVIAQVAAEPELVGDEEDEEAKESKSFTKDSESDIAEVEVEVQGATEQAEPQVDEESENFVYNEMEEEDTASDTGSESISEPGQEVITAAKGRDSIALVKGGENDRSPSSIWSPVLTVLLAWGALAALMLLLFLQVKMDDFNVGNLELLLPSVEFSDVQSGVQALFSGVEETPEEVVKKAPFFLQGGCKGVYCGFY